MKNIIYGFGLSVLTVILLLIITTTSGRMMREAEIRESLANAVDNAVENAIETNTYSINDRDEFVSDVMQNLALQYHSTSEKVRVAVNSADCEKGTLFITATAFYKNPIGNTGSVEYSKKSIYATKNINEDHEYAITYMLDGETTYRTYCAKDKDDYPVPEDPKETGKIFIHWVDAEGNAYVKGNNFPATVEKSATYYAEFSTTSVPAQSLTLEGEADTMTVGSKQSLSATVLPENATNKAVKWKSSDSSVLSVNSIGFVTALKVGEADITVELADGSLPPASCHIKVIEVSDILVTADTSFINEEETRKITVTTPEGELINADCSFASSNPSVIRVNSIGVMEPGNPGTAYITVSHRRSGASVTIPVMVANVTDYQGVYDENPHGIKVDCPGAEITYATNVKTAADESLIYMDETEVNPVFTDAGEYIVYYRIRFSSCNVIEGNAYVTIEKAERELSLSASEDTLIYPEEKTYTFETDGDDLDEVSVQTENNNGCLTAIKEGNSVVVTSGIKEGDVDLSICVPESGNYKMTQKTIKIHVKNGVMELDVTVPQNGVYDGENHTISITPKAPCEDAVITYSSTQDGEYTSEAPECIDAGTHTVYYRAELPGYKTINGSQNVVIKRAPGEVTFNKKEIALTQGDSCILTVEKNCSEGDISLEVKDNSLISVQNLYDTVKTEEIKDEETGEVIIPESTYEIFTGYKISAKDGARGFTTIKVISKAGENYEQSECVIPVYIGEECGIYDTEGKLILTWDDFISAGADITKDYTAESYKTDETSAYSVLKVLKEGKTVLYEDNSLKGISVGKIVVPATRAKIGNYAFAGIDTVTEVVILSGVTKIGENAFSDCPKLSHVELPSTIENIGNDAFAGVSVVCADKSLVGAPWGAGQIHDYNGENNTCIYCGAERQGNGLSAVSLNQSVFFSKLVMNLQKNFAISIL